MKVYCKQPFQAEQFDGSNEMVKKYRVRKDTEYMLSDDPLEYQTVPYQIETLEGWANINVGDWIAAGVNGERWAIKNDVFKKTYAELPVIPDYVTNLIESYKVRGWGLMRFMSEQYLKHTSDYSFWINDNPEVIARAWLDGYTVEEEK